MAFTFPDMHPDSSVERTGVTITRPIFSSVVLIYTSVPGSPSSAIVEPPQHLHLEGYGATSAPTAVTISSKEADFRDGRIEWDTLRHRYKRPSNPSGFLTA